MSRFGPIRTTPPHAVLDQLPAAVGPWAADRMGNEGGYPNGGMWRFCAGRR
ncbi:MAG: hypothetical protein ACR2F6_05880 [Mycobacteriales bacterium]